MDKQQHNGHSNQTVHLVLPVRMIYARICTSTYTPHTHMMDETLNVLAIPSLLLNYKRLYFVQFLGKWTIDVYIIIQFIHVSTLYVLCPTCNRRT